MTFRLAPMDFLMRLLTLALLALPPLFLAIALLGNRWLLGPAVFLGALYVWIWLWFRPTRFVVQPRVLEIVWPARRREIPREDVVAVRLLDKHELRRAAFAPSFPSAVRVFFGRCAIVRLRRAAAAAFLMLRRAAARCFPDAIRRCSPWPSCTRRTPSDSARRSSCCRRARRACRRRRRRHHRSRRPCPRPCRRWRCRHPVRRRPRRPAHRCPHPSRRSGSCRSWSSRIRPGLRPRGCTRRRRTAAARRSARPGPTSTAPGPAWWAGQPEAAWSAPGRPAGSP